MRKEIVVDEKPVMPLSEMEKARYKKLNKEILRNLGAFYVVGMSLMEIRDRELYREDFKSFEAYCKKVFDLGKSHSYRLTWP